MDVAVLQRSPHISQEHLDLGLSPAQHLGEDVHGDALRNLEQVRHHQRAAHLLLGSPGPGVRGDGDLLLRHVDEAGVGEPVLEVGDLEGVFAYGFEAFLFSLSLATYFSTKH